MATQDRRAVSHPSSYKKFNEVGMDEDNTSEMLDTALLPLQSNTDANGAETVNNMNTDNIPSSAVTTVDYSQDLESTYMLIMIMMT